MRAIETITGRVSVLKRDDVDTDQIIPKQFLKRVERTGFGEFLFFDWAKQPGWDLPQNPILVAGRNFGCGSSREQAVWALADFGIRCIIAPSFGEIFHTNCFRNGVLAITLDDAQHRDAIAAAAAGKPITVHLDAQLIHLAEGRTIAFDIDLHRRRALLLGLDQIGAILADDAADIAAFEKHQRSAAPWLYLERDKLSSLDCLEIRGAPRPAPLHHRGSCRLLGH
jgi:3-isopropylmalate/(R)-2-methylmalate dehydratase small subunit